MTWELDAVGFLYVIDTRNHKTLRMQCQPGPANPLTAVVEVKRALGPSATDPSRSFSTTQTLTLDGSAVTEIDVTDEPYVHVVCTTAQSGVSVDIAHSLTGSMSGQARSERVEFDAVGRQLLIGADHKTIVAVVPDSSVTTGAMEIKHSVRADLTPVSLSPAATLTIDGSTFTEIDTSGSGVLHGVCTTAQSGLAATVYIYTRDEVAREEVTNDQLNFGGLVFVDSKSDFPPASGGVITLAAKTTYQIAGTIDLDGDRLVCGEDTCIIGTTSENCVLKSTGLTGTALITSSYSLPMRHLTITADVALALSGNITSTALDWYGVNFTNCGEVGTIEDHNNVIWSTCALISSGGLVFDGQISTVGITNTLLLGSGSSQNIIEIPATANITRRFRVTDCAVIAPSTDTGLNVSASATIPDESYILRNVNFSGSGTYLAGLDYTSNTARFTGCVGITNTAELAAYSMQNNATATTISTSGTPVKAAGTTTASSVNQKFTHTSNRLTYSGALTRAFSVEVCGSATSGNGKQIGFYVAKNGSVINESEIYVTTNSGSRAEGVACQTIVELATNDYIEIFVENATDTTNITVTELIVIVQAAA